MNAEYAGESGSKRVRFVLLLPTCKRALPGVKTRRKHYVRMYPHGVVIIL